jgi:8-oxo-dGTP diphosphatase
MKIVAKALIYNNEGKVLLLKRSDTHPHYPLHWDFPGGLIEQDESERDGVIREIMEEIGLHLDSRTIKKVFERTKASGTVHLVYEVHIETTPDINISWEHDSYIWMSMEEFKSLEIPRDVDTYYETVLQYFGRNN